jgi:hypothetical protein
LDGTLAIDGLGTIGGFGAGDAIVLSGGDYQEFRARRGGLTG